MIHKNLNSKDHYVSQTYLRYFSDSPNFVFIYRKKTGLCKSVSIKSILTNRGGDICRNIGNIFGLREILSIIEPMWNIFITAVKNKNLIEVHHEHSKSEEIPFLGKIVLYIAYLRCLSPTMHLLAKEQQESMINNFILPAMAESDKNCLNEATRKAIMDKDIKVEIGNLDYFKGEGLRLLCDIAEIFYNRNWVILRNKTEIKFITSDTPIISLIGGDLYFPLSPEYALVIQLSPGNKIDYANLTPFDVRKYNKEIVRWALDLVISSKEDEGINRLVKKYREYKPIVEFNSIQNFGSKLIPFQHITIREKQRN